MLAIPQLLAVAIGAIAVALISISVATRIIRRQRTTIKDLKRANAKLREENARFSRSRDREDPSKKK